MTTQGIMQAVSGLAGTEVITQGETATPPSGKHICWVMPLNDNATLDGISNGPAGFSTTQVLTKDVVYPLYCSDLTLDAASAGDLLVAYI